MKGPMTHEVQGVVVGQEVEAVDAVVVDAVDAVDVVDAADAVDVWDASVMFVTSAVFSNSV